jgi:hypothetical protein
LTNALPCAEEPYLNGSLRHVQHLCNVGLRQIGTVPERQQCALLYRHIGKSAPEVKHIYPIVGFEGRPKGVLILVIRLVVGSPFVASETS